MLADAARTDPDAHSARQNLSRAGLGIVPVAILVLLLPLGFLTHSGLVLYLVFAVGSNVHDLKEPALALRLERIGTPVALFFAGRSREVPAPGPAGLPDGTAAAATGDQPWSAMDGHRMHTLGNPVLVFCVVAAWSVALIMAVGLVVPGPDKPALAVAFVGFAALGALPALTVRRRRSRDRAWARELAAGPSAPGVNS